MKNDSPGNRNIELENINQVTHQPEVRFFITHQTGFLGNQLIMFSHFIASAIENNHKIINTAFFKYSNLFETTSKDAYCRYPAKRSIFVNDLFRKALYKTINFIVRDWIIRKLGFLNINIIKAYNTNKEFRLDAPGIFSSKAKRQTIFAEGYYFCDYINLLKHADEIKNFFVPLASHQKNISELIDRARKDCDVLVGIHIRHGDYKNYRNGKYYYDIDEYINVMNNFKNLFSHKKVAFLVCSNEILDKDRFGEINVIFGTHDIIEDMYSFARCNYIIGPFSTYTRWASFYGNVPLYWIEDPNKDICLDDFLSHEEIVHHHMQYAPNFPRFDDACSQADLRSKP